MKKRNLLVALAIAGTMSATAQVRIGGEVVPNPSAVLDLNPDDHTAQGNATLGLAMPRVNLVTTANAAPMAAHVHGMTVFNMATQNDVTPGIYYNDGSKWQRLSSNEIHLPNGVNDGDMFVWNTNSNQWEAQPEKDGVIGNEVTDATDRSLSRSGAGTANSPYTLAVSESGIETKHLKDGSVTTEKLANNAVTTEKIVNKAITNEKLADNSVTTTNIADNSITNQKIVNKSVSKDKIGDDVWQEITNEINNISFTEVDGVIGNEVTDATDGSLTRSGLGTSVSPYTLAVSENGIENKHLKDGSITNNKIVNKTISKEKLGDDVWNMIKNEISNSSINSEVDGVIGNEVIGSADASLTRSGDGTAISPYRLAVSVGGIETVHLKDGAVTTEKIGNNAITQNKIADNSIITQKIVNKSVSKDKLSDDVWQEITNEINSISFTEVDGVIGNEVTDATDGSLTRSGAGTAISPYTLAVSVNGIENKHLKDGSITNNKIVNKTISKEKLGDDVWNEVKTEITNLSISSEVDGIIGNEVTDATDGSLTRSGAGTAISPYTLAVSVGGIETVHLKDGAVTTEKIGNNAITQNKIADNSITTPKIVNKSVSKDKLGDDVWQEITNEINGISFTEIDGVIGNEVTDATDGSLTRSGLGTAISPYTLAVSEGGIETKHLQDAAVTAEKIADNSITANKFADVQSNSILYTDGSNKWATFTRKVEVGVFNVPNDSSLIKCALKLPEFGAGLYGIHIVCDADLPMAEGEIVPSYFRFLTDRKPFGMGTVDVYIGNLSFLNHGDSHSTTAWLYDCKPTELQLYCRNSGTKPVNFRIVCTWLMPF